MKPSQLPAIVVTTLLTAFSACAAQAQLTVNGAVGLPLNPTSQIASQNKTQVQGNFSQLAKFDYEGFINQPPFAENDGSSLNFYGVNAAKGISKRLELNGGIEKLDGPRRTINRVTSETEIVDGIFVTTQVVTPVARLNYNRTGLALGAKYLLAGQNEPTKPQIAVGLGYSRARFDNFYAYVVGSKSFGDSNNKAPIRAHLGARYDRFNTDFITTVLDSSLYIVDDQSSKKASFYGGVEVPLTRNGEFAFVGEMQSKNSDYFGSKSPYSAALRYSSQNSSLSATLGLQRSGGPISDKGRLFAQLGYAFGAN